MTVREACIALAITLALTLITVAVTFGQDGSGPMGMSSTQTFVLALVGLFVTPAAAIITAIVTSRLTRNDVKEVHNSLNSRMTEALTAKAVQSHAEGVLEERQRWEGKAKSFAQGETAERGRTPAAPAVQPSTEPTLQRIADAVEKPDQ